MNTWISSLTDTSAIVQSLDAVFGRFPILERLFTQYNRYALVLLAALTVFGCIASLLRERYAPELWGHLYASDGEALPLNHWENIIGRAMSSDVVLSNETVSRTHAAVTRDAQGAWNLIPLASKNILLKNAARRLHPVPITSGDVITAGGVKLTFRPATLSEQSEQAKKRTRPGMLIRPWVILL